MGWKLEARVIELPLAATFRIARKTWDSATNVFVVVEHSGMSGVGEVNPDDHWGETGESVAEQLGSTSLGSLNGPYDIEGVTALLPPGSARCALDIAIHDLAAKLAGISVAEMLGLGGRPIPKTSVTVPIDDTDAMVERARDFTDHPIIKTKVGFDGDVDAIAAIREVFGGRIRVDANEGWSVDEAIERLTALETFDIELCEQPIPMGDLDGLRRITEVSPIPVFADEDAGTSSDVGRLSGCVHGVNLKLRKAGGIRETVRAMNTARALGMQVMLGCDLVTGVSAGAEAAIASLADFVDIDGPLLLKHDPLPSVTYDRGVVTPATGPGLGVTGLPW